jgi:membrane protein YqaA with SNARE-associated domain
LWSAIAVATVGNTCGGITSYWLGRLFPNKAEGKAIEWLKKYGMWALLFSWVPLFGDALSVAAGWMRFNFWACMALFAVGKLFRYLLVAGGWTWFLSTIWPWMKVTFGW